MSFSTFRTRRWLLVCSKPANCLWRAGTSLLLAVGCACAVAQTPAPANQPIPAAPVNAPTDDSPRFDILEFVVEGNTVLTAEDIERAVYRFMGEKRNIDDVDAARAALEKIYRDKGYGTVGVDIPEQQVSSGVIVLRVQEGRVSRLRVMGSRYFSQGYILEKVPSAAEGQVPRFADLQTQLGTVNRTADRRVSPLLRPGRTPGTTEVDLVVEDKLPLHASVEVNNRASPNTSATRLQASARYDNLWQRDHSLGLQLQLSPQKTSEVRVLSASYSLPMGDVGQDNLSFSLTRSDSEVAAGVGSTTVFGKGSIFGVRRSFALDLREREFHSITIGADYKNFSETIDAGSGETFATPIRYAPLSLNYVGGWESGQGRWQIGTSLVVGVRGLASKEAQFADKRYQGTAGFSVLKFDLSREQKLLWGLAGWAKLDGQLGAQPLISNEQFVAGGVDSVRGYLESAAAGDRGLRISTELRSPEFFGKEAAKDWPWLNSAFGGWLGSLRMHGFFDAAALELRQPLPDQKYRFRLMSAGVGLRMKGARYGTLSLDLGVPLLSFGNTQRGDVRLHFSAAIEF
jgi:hemolysin activation/secretion protein